MLLAGICCKQGMTPTNRKLAAEHVLQSALQSGDGKSFEHLVHALLKSWLGLAVESWGGGNDGGRDAFYKGTLRYPNDKDLVTTISIRCHGQIVGKATLSLLNDDGSSARNHEIHGKFDISLGGDWYTPKAELRYSPIGVRSGNVQIEFSFGALKSDG